MEIRESKIQGKGIFATKRIHKDERFYDVPINSISSTSQPKYARIGKQKWIADDKVLNFVNHSCDPNAKLDISTDQPFLIALRDIEIGEEITCDYDLTEKEGKKIPCTCGSAHCRGYFFKSETFTPDLHLFYKEYCKEMEDFLKLLKK